jgi:outer membrane immunogenic protein
MVSLRNGAVFFQRSIAGCLIMKLKLILATAAAAFASSSAFAADAIVAYDPPPVVAVEVPVGYDWSGIYVGASAGYVIEYGTQVAAFTPAGDRFSNRYIRDAEGFIGGAFVGYNWANNNVLFGLEGDLEYADNSGSRETFGGFAETSVDIGLQGTIRARLGYTFDRTLVYATGGVAFGDVEIGVTDPAGTFSDSSTRVGYTVGAGVEHAVTDNWLIRAEYRFTDFGDETIDTGLASYNFDTQNHAVKAGIAYKF